MTNQSPLTPPFESETLNYICARAAQCDADQAKADIRRERQEAANEAQRRFLAWWQNEGSAMRPLAEEDTEAHMRRVTEIAWLNGAYCARYPF